jgi:hypothetical protein
MIRRKQVVQLLQQVPEEAMPQVVEFLRLIAQKPKSLPATRKRKRGQPAGIAERSFGLVPVDVATVKEVL